MSTATNGISVKIPEKVFFSSDKTAYTVKNNFWFTIFKENPDSGDAVSVVRKGEAYPTIYIKGFEQLFKNDGIQAQQLDLFFKMFNSGGNKDWDISYGKFRDTDEYCAVITCAANSLKPNFSIGLQLSDKCAFTKIPDTGSPITLEVFIDDFDVLFSDLSDRIKYNISLERGFAVYIENFGAYPTAEAKSPVTAIHKGDECFISWKIEKNQQASAFLYDENGAILTNLPPYTATIDRDRKFTLVAYNDYCSVMQSVVVHRTLWDKSKEAPTLFPKADEKGRFKFYRSYGDDYYLYVHPKLYRSRDFKTWQVLSENTLAPSGYKFYSSSFSGQRLGVCYLSDNNFTYCEMNLNDETWKKYDFDRKERVGACALYTGGGKIKIVLCTEDDVSLYDLIGGRLMNEAYLEMPADAEIMAMDAMTDAGHIYLAFSCNNGRIYFYDLNDDFRDNIFECPNTVGDEIYLVKSNALYIVASGCMFEVSDREKFTDCSFFPQTNGKQRPIIGDKDSETIVGVFQGDKDTEAWDYKF